MRRSALPLLALLLVAAPASAVPIQFGVAEPEGMRVHGDSYVLVLEDPAHIAHARELIALGPAAGAPIVVARIAPGADGINRNWLAPGQPPWSWHVTAFDGFADVTIEILDGTPTFVEENLDFWMANTGGWIGFWRYTVVAELGPVPEPGTGVLVSLGLGWLAGRRGRRPRARRRCAPRA